MAFWGSGDVPQPCLVQWFVGVSLYHFNVYNYALLEVDWYIGVVYWLEDVDFMYGIWRRYMYMRYVEYTCTVP